MSIHPRPHEKEDPEPGELPVEPDEGPIPAGSPVDPGEDAIGDPEV